MTKTKNIYIVGYSLRLPESNNAFELHENLMQKINMVTQDDRRWPSNFNNTPPYFGKIKQSIDHFDNVFFGIHGGQAEKLDPQLRLLLETSFEALIDAAVFPEEIKGTETGVYTGTCFSDVHRFFMQDSASISGYEHTGCAATMFANRLSYFYDLHGPSMNVDTACASSLTALHYALKDLKADKCNTAIVCGTSILLHSAATLSFKKLQVLSPDGFCKSFDQSANGYTRAEGIVTLILTTRSELLHYQPYATVLASSINTTGYQEKGIFFPSRKWQASLYKDIQKEAELKPNEIKHIECHGTGTLAGDTEELEGIKDFFGNREDLTIGALKSNIGHTEGASGLANVAKLLLSYENKTLYPQLHLNNPNPSLGKLRPLHEAEPWQGGKALVNSFGFGGANACVLLENLNDTTVLYTTPWHQLFFISSRTKEGLYELKHELEKIPHQLPTYKSRSYLWREVVGVEDAPILEPIENRPLYFAFSGNGSQWKGMGLQLMQVSALFKKTISACGADLPGMLETEWYGALADTRLLTAIQIALIELLKSLGIYAEGYIAHSAGEIAAGYATGATTLQETMAIAEARGRAAEEMPDGAMVSVGLDEIAIIPYLQDAQNVSIACINSPRNITLSGNKEQLDSIVKRLEAEEIFVRPLNTHGKPYHSTLINATNVKKHLENVGIQPVKKQKTWLSTIQGYHPHEFSAEYHLQSVTQPVDFCSGMKKVPENAIVLEIGPHRVLRALIRDCAPSTQYVSLMEKEVDDFLSFKQGIAQLWRLGMNIQYTPDKKRSPLFVRAKQVSWDRNYFPLPRENQYANHFHQTVAFELQKADAYLLGHSIDNRPIFPATGYIYIFWQCFLRNHPTAKTVSLEKFNILRAVPLIEERIRFEILISPNGRYELLYNQEIIAQANLHQTEQPTNFIIPSIPEFQEKDTIDKETFYRYCHKEGYGYKDSFQVVEKIHISDNPQYLFGSIHFKEWISFLDGLLQISLLNKQSTGLCLPTAIRRIELSPNYSDTVCYNRYTNTIQCGEILIQGLESKTAIRKETTEKSVYLKEDYLFCGKNETDSKRSNYLEGILAYSIAQFKTIEHDLTASHHIKIRKILKDYSIDCDVKRLKEIHNHSYISLVDEVYSQKEIFLSSPISTIAQNQHYADVYYADYMYDIHYLEKTLSVIRENTNQTLNIFEIGTGTGGFLKLLSNSLHTQDNIVCTDIVKNRFIHNEITKKLNINYDDYDIDQEMNPEIKAMIGKSDVVLATNALHVSHDLKLSLERFYNAMKPGAFMLLIETTSPLLLSLFGMDKETWHFKDTREYGLWASTERWLGLFKQVNFKLVSYLTDPKEVLTTFLIRKPFGEDTYQMLASPSAHYNEDWAEQIKTNPGPFIFYDKNPGGMAGFARTLNREGKRSISLCAPLIDDFIEEVKEYQLVTNIVKKNKLATLCYISDKNDPLYANKKDGFHLEFIQPGNIDSTSFVKNKPQKEPLCKVAYAALNFRDVMLASGKISKETFMGVSKNSSGVGIEFSGALQGQRIMGFGLDTFSNYVKTDFVWPIPEDMDLAEAATIPVAYLTVYYAFFERALLERTHKVLIHSGAGAVGQAAIRVALDVGCEVFTTCHQSKRAFLKELFPQLDDNHIGDSRSTTFEQLILSQTQGLGVDVILNSLADEKLQSSLICLAQHGVFLEIGKYDLMRDTPIGMRHLLPNTTLCGIDLDQALTDKKVSQRISRHLKKGLDRGVVKPINHTVFNWTKISDAFRYLGAGKHLGKVLIDMREAAPTEIVNRFYTSGVHIIVGGLGGFGMALAEWLAERGAEHLVLVTRNGVKTGEQKWFLQKLKLKYDVLTVEIITADLSDNEQAQKMLGSYSTITGVYNLAMVLNDTTFAGMTEEKWNNTVNCKIEITKHLDRYTQHSPVQHFVCFSSITVHGNPGQSNYAFANNYLEAICYARRKKGLSGIAVQWGGIGDVGFVARKGINNLPDLGIGLLPISTALKYLEDCLLSENTVVSLIYQIPSVENNNKLSKSNILDKIAQILRIDLSKVPESTSLISLGMDSLQTAELQSLISRSSQEMISFQSLASKTIGDLKKEFEISHNETINESIVCEGDKQEKNDVSAHGINHDRPIQEYCADSSTINSGLNRDKVKHLQVENKIEHIPNSFHDIKSLSQYKAMNFKKVLAKKAKVEIPFYRSFNSASTDTINYKKQQLINFASYNYLGYNNEPAVSERANHAIKQFGTSSASSRIVSGEKEIHLQLEAAIAELYEVEDSMVFVSGYATNISVISHLMGTNDLIIHDSYAHNSIIMGSKFSDATRKSFQHNNLEELELILKESRHHYERVLIIVEGLYSMDGDAAPLSELVSLKKRYKCLLMVDEAHSIGVLGKNGLGIREHCQVKSDDVDIWMGTLSKTFAGCGGYIAGCKELIDYLKYSSPGFIFSVGLSPAIAGACLAAIELLKSDNTRVQKLQHNSQYFLSLVQEKKMNTGYAEGYAIIPIIIGDSINTAKVANAMFDEHINVQTILYPGVEENAARLRFFITALHSEQQIEHAVQILEKSYYKFIKNINNHLIAEEN